MYWGRQALVLASPLVSLALPERRYWRAADSTMAFGKAASPAHQFSPELLNGKKIFQAGSVHWEGTLSCPDKYGEIHLLMLRELKHYGHIGSGPKFFSKRAGEQQNSRSRDGKNSGEECSAACHFRNPIGSIQVSMDVIQSH